MKQNKLISFIQVCDPRITADFWQTWKEFEVRHGNEDTMREMLRIKRSVQATYNTQVNMMAAQFLSSSSTAQTAADAAGNDAMRALEAKATEAAAAAKDKQTLKPQTSSNIMFVRGETQGGSAKDKVVNPDEIDIGDSDEEDDEEEDDNDKVEDEENSTATSSDAAGKTIKKLRIEQKVIPAKVFGGLKPNKQQNDDEDD